MAARLKFASRDIPHPEGGIKTLRGTFISILADGQPFGPNTEPNFVQLTVTGTNHVGARKFLDNWDIDFSHTLVTENPQRWRFRIEVEAQFVSLTGVGRGELKAGMQDFIRRVGTLWDGVWLQAFTPDSMLINVPKNGVWQTANPEVSDNGYLAALKRDFSDIFRTRLRKDRYYVSEEDVDLAVANGREMTITAAQALARIKDRLDE